MENKELLGVLKFLFPRTGYSEEKLKKMTENPGWFDLNFKSCSNCFTKLTERFSMNKQEDIIKIRAEDSEGAYKLSSSDSQRNYELDKTQYFQKQKQEKKTNLVAPLFLASAKETNRMLLTSASQKEDTGKNYSDDNSEICPPPKPLKNNFNKELLEKIHKKNIVHYIDQQKRRSEARLGLILSNRSRESQSIKTSQTSYHISPRYNSGPIEGGLPNLHTQTDEVTASSNLHFKSPNTESEKKSRSPNKGLNYLKDYFQNTAIHPFDRRRSTNKIKLQYQDPTLNEFSCSINRNQSTNIQIPLRNTIYLSSPKASNPNNTLSSRSKKY